MDSQWNSYGMETCKCIGRWTSVAEHSGAMMDIYNILAWRHGGTMKWITFTVKFFFLAFSCLVAKAQKGDSDIYHHSKKQKKRHDIVQNIHLYYSKMVLSKHLLLDKLHKVHMGDRLASEYVLYSGISYSHIFQQWTSEIHSGPFNNSHQDP